MYSIPARTDTELTLMQIALHAIDEHAILFLRDSANGIVQHQQNSPIFGTCWSPSIATFVLQKKTRTDFVQDLHGVKKRTHESFYTDDLVYSIQPLEDVVQKNCLLSAVLTKAGLIWTKFVSSERVRHCLPNHHPLSSTTYKVYPVNPEMTISCQSSPKFNH